MNKNVERLYNGLIKENPTFVLMLGMCPTLAVTSSAINGLGMGLSTTVVLVLSNMLISAFRKVIPESNSKWCQNAGIHCYRCIAGNSGAVYHAGVYPEPLRVAGCVYPVNRCKLYYPRPC